MMRRATVVLSVLGLLWQTAACSSDGPSTDPSGVQPSVVSPSVPPAPSGTQASEPAPPETAGPPPRVPPSRSRPGSPAAPPAPSGDVPGPLPWGARTLTGVVERSGDCTMLLVGKRRWALTGPAAAALRPGDKVTVRGSLTTRPAACGDQDLAQTVAVTRVRPA